uniref:Uncharacterized protein n=1 Tax=Cynoglossus semilaevis TaxID=244447 RepID=A0A3P8VK70_CYNSE
MSWHLFFGHSFFSGFFFFSFPSEFESSQVTEKKRTVYQMALSKNAHARRCGSSSVSSTVNLCSLRHRWNFFMFFYIPVSLLGVPLSSFLSVSLSPCLSVSPVFIVLSDKLDEILAAAQQTISTNETPGTRGQGAKRDRGRSFYGNEQSFGDQSGMGLMSSGLGLGYDRGQFTSGHGPPHGMLRQKSIGVPEEERQFLHPPAMKFTRSLSVPGPDDIPPPPTTAPPDPPFSSAPPLGWRAKTSQQPSVSVSQSTSTSAHYQPYSQSVHFTHGGRERSGAPSTGPGSGAVDHTVPYAHAAAHTAQSRTASRKVAYSGEPVGGGIGGSTKAAGLRRGYSTAVPPSSIATVIPQQQQTTQSQPQRTDRTVSGAGAGGPKGGARRGKGPLVKQSKVEDLRVGQGTLGGKGSVEKSSIPIPTIIVKAPSTSSSGRSSQGSSVEADAPATGETDDAKTPHGPPPSTPAPQPPAPPSIPAPPPPSLPSIRAQENLDFTSQFGAAIVGAARRDRERFHEARKKSASLFMSAEEDTSLGGVSDGVALTRTQVSQQQLTTQADGSSARLRPSKSIDEGMFSGDTFIHHTRSMPPAFGLPEYSSPAVDYQPKSVPTDLYTTAGRPTAPSTSTFIHPLTGKALDPSSPLGLALAARERALRDDSRYRRGAEHQFSRQMSSVVFPSSAVTSQPVSSAAQSSSSSYLVTSSSLAATTPTVGRPPSPRILRGIGNVWGEDGGPEREREGGGAREGLRVRFSEDKTVHTHHYQAQSYQQPYKERERERSRERERERDKEREGYMRRAEHTASAESSVRQGTQSQVPQRPSFLRMESQADAYILSLTPPSPPPTSVQQTTGSSGTGLCSLPLSNITQSSTTPLTLHFAANFNSRTTCSAVSLTTATYWIVPQTLLYVPSSPSLQQHSYAGALFSYSSPAHSHTPPCLPWSPSTLLQPCHLCSFSGHCLACYDR